MLLKGARYGTNSFPAPVVENPAVRLTTVAAPAVDKS